MTNVKYGFGINNNFFEFDLINSFSISENSTVSEFPVVSKQLIVDHKFNEPRSISLSGTVSRSVLKKHPVFKETTVIEHSDKENEVISEGIMYQSGIAESYLTSVYEFLRSVKNKNVIVDLITPNTIIKSCVIVDIQWNDFNTYAEFSLSFKEIKTLSFREIEIQTIKPDPNLPDLNDAIPQSAIETLILQDTSETDLLVYKALVRNEEHMTNQFWNTMMVNLAAGVGLAIVGGLVVWGLVALATALSASGPIGWIIGAVIAVLAVVGWLCYQIYKAWKKAQRAKVYIRKFEYFKNKKKQKEEENRYKEFCEKLYGQLKNLNSVIYGYSIKQNIKQDVLVSVDDNLIVIKIEKDKQQGNWRWMVLDQEEKIIQQWQDLKPFKTIYKCASNNSHYELGNGKLYFVYDIKSINKDDPCDYVSMNVDLTKITIITTNFNMDKLKTTIGELAIQGMRIKK